MVILQTVDGTVLQDSGTSEEISRSELKQVANIIDKSNEKAVEYPK